MSTQITISPEIKLVVNTTPITGGSAGQILFQTTGNTVGESANLSWDNTNARLRVNGAVIAGNGLCSLTNGPGNYGQVGSNYYYDGATPRRWGNDHAAQIDFGLGFKFRVAGNGASGSAISWSELGYWNASTGNLLVGTTTDAGYKLDVNGTFRATVSTETNPFVFQHTNGNFASIVIGNGSQFAPGQFGMHFNGAGVWSWSGSAFRIHGGILSSNANALTFKLIGGFGGSTLGTSIKLASNTFNAGQFTATSGTQNTVEIGSTNNEIWAPTSGNATYNLFVIVPRINTSGTYAGIVRGIIYAPTLTSITGVDHRAIETTTGNVLFGTTSGNVGIGTTSPTNKLQVVGASRFTTTINVGGDGSTGGSLSSGFIVQDNGNGYGSSFVHCQSARLTLFANPQGFAIGGFEPASSGLVSSDAIAFMNASTTRMKIPTTGNVLIGTTTDAGFRLDVNGTARVSGALTLGNGIIFNVDGSTTRMFNSSQINYQANVINGTQHYFVNQQGYNTGTIMSIHGGGAANPSTTGSMAIQSLSGAMSFASGTANYNAVQILTNIQNTGTFSGTIRGFYYNPTVSGSGYSHFAFHSTSGRVRFEGLPTSPTGLNAGDIYNDGGTLKIV